MKTDYMTRVDKEQLKDQIIKLLKKMKRFKKKGYEIDYIRESIIERLKKI